VSEALSVVQVSPSDTGGGAERVALGLHEEYRRRGHSSRLVVGRRFGDAPGLVELRNGGGAWRLQDGLRRRGRLRTARAVKALAAPGSALDYLRGREDFRWPGTAVLPEAGGERPGVLQLHNLHGAYFDLRRLPRLTREVPTVLSPHDLWLATGHCAHGLECERWVGGCGACPHLDVYPALRRDGTAANWARKRALYAETRLRVGVPCRWLAEALERSILGPAIAELRVIPTGVDLSVFRPGHAAEARRRLPTPPEGRVVAFGAVGGARNRFKDYPTFEAALRRLAESAIEPVTAYALGSPSARRRSWGRVTLVDVPPVGPAEVADHLRAAEVYVHASRADTFPLGVLEALACGTPVIASAVGGIPEQLSADTGVLVPPENAGELASAAERLLADGARRASMATAAASVAAGRYGRERQAGAYLEWFAELVQDRPSC
jgi:glycosyltransferase involved in cell wall biosynthesis